MPEIRSKFEMAAIVAWLRRSRKSGMTAEDLRKRTALDHGVDRALGHLVDEGWVIKNHSNGKYSLTPDQVK